MTQPKRKHPRLRDYDYSRTGVYFLTICTRNRAPILSEIVGRGLAPAGQEEWYMKRTLVIVGLGLIGGAHPAQGAVRVPD